MWKLIVGFIVFAAVALFILKKAGGDIDMGGEKHGIETAAPADVAASTAAMPMPAASAASAAASN